MILQDFQFASPWYLILLVALPFFHGGILRIQKKGLERLYQFLSPKNLSELERERWIGGTKRKFILFWVGLGFFSLALARPQANPIIEDLEGASLDIYVLMDVSKSMDAEDVVPSRIKKAKRSVENLLQFLSGDRVGIIVFAGTSVMISPLTADYDILRLFLGNVDTNLIQNQGTNVGGALETALQAMKRGAEKFGADTRSNVFLLLSDGEDTNEPNFEIAKQIREQGGIIFSIAFGTEAGASIPIRNIRGELSGYKRDRRGNQVVTKVEPSTLRQYAEATGGSFYFSTTEETEIKDILQRIQNFERSNASVRKARLYQEYFYLPLSLGILCIVLSFFSARVLFSLSNWKKVLRASGILLLISPSEAFSGPLDYLYDSTKRNYKRSLELAEAGKPEEAANQMKELLAENPEDESIALNLGILNGKAKKTEEANQQFDRLIQKNTKWKSQAKFNSAGTFGSIGKAEEARSRYAELLSELQQKPELSKEEEQLLQQARINLSKLSQNQQQQNQSSSGPNGQSGSGSNENESKGGSGENGQGSQDQKQNNQSNQGDGKGKEEKQNQSQNSESSNGQDKDKEKKNDSSNPSDGPEDSNDSKNADESEGENEEDQNRQESQGSSAPMASGNPNKQKYLKKNYMEESDAKRILEALKQRESSLQKKFMRFEGKGNEDLRDNNEKDW